MDTNDIDLMLREVLKKEEPVPSEVNKMLMEKINRKKNKNLILLAISSLILCLLSGFCICLLLNSLLIKFFVISFMIISFLGLSGLIYALTFSKIKV